MRSICNADGDAIELGAELGRGGEGAVYELPQRPELVAKLYHAPPAAAKQSKLRLMADSIDSPLREYAAWPEDTLHDDHGAVIGFTMQRIEQRLPIHMLYSPAQRRESFPKARFDFLVFVARNVAAAFETLHAHGHVLGDVNQGNVLVGEDSRVILIDCDSFQIQVGDALHRCEVGVAHFTPPELQSITSFEDITRTPNHDAFGLALLIFHLLMGGRHPYSGVPLSDQVGESLEADIRDLRYAYAVDAEQRKIAPPPKSVPIKSLPPDIVALFEQAFGAQGAAARPTPQQWLTALDGLRAGLKPCAKNALHLYAAHLGECQWCALDRQHVVFFGELSRPVERVAVRPDVLDLDRMEAEFKRLNLAEPVEMPQFSMPTRTTGLASTELSASNVAPFIAFVALLPLHGFLPVWLSAPLQLLAFGWVIAANAQQFTHSIDAFQLHELQRFEKLERRLRAAVSSINAANGSALVARWRSAVSELRAHLSEDRASLALAAPGASDHRLRDFLGKHKIRHWQDGRVSATQRLLLESSGVETAADFDAASLKQLRVVEAAAREALLRWRADLILAYRRRGASTRTREGREFLQRWRTRQRTLEVEVRDAFAKLQARPPQVAVSAERTRELQTLRAETTLAHTRWLQTTKSI